MRPFILSFLGAVALAGCTAAGSSTVVGQPGTGTPETPPTGETPDGGQPSAATDYAALFGPPASTSATPNKLNGLWAGESEQFTDLRIKFDDDTFLIATRCNADTVVGLTATARISSSSISILESKSAAPPPPPPGSLPTKYNPGCSINLKPVEITRCTSITQVEAENEGLSSEGGCFYISSTKLNFYNTFLSGAKLTKLSD
jgi:hypothetical protein